MLRYLNPTIVHNSQDPALIVTECCQLTPAAKNIIPDIIDRIVEIPAVEWAAFIAIRKGHFFIAHNTSTGALLFDAIDECSAIISCVTAPDSIVTCFPYVHPYANSIIESMRTHTRPDAWHCRYRNCLHAPTYPRHLVRYIDRSPQTHQPPPTILRPIPFTTTQ